MPNTVACARHNLKFQQDDVWRIVPWGSGEFASKYSTNLCSVLTIVCAQAIPMR
ncbi:hypothetical protein POSPLADRAFT_1041517 [Postia placenta MAD-698-R-SB12]|uniref:Uncharacterized protein n=1 Tax=Postia placenta MAD-698-R-SB12 TaxID=670580 RepID=A0A1X6MNQ2_9APHY|nr:hypothetical protein POSPLADRAFT_1041517 [Postia placenta MAD-698-R-SB12]OSX58054.1 hypothetical protein POSPLADRAFT_1041517 [Postia placenta MAD-698-R-SB12]